jgi:hypothetical protein
MFRPILLTIAIVSMVCYLGCKDPTGNPISVTPPGDGEIPLTKDDSVVVNCYLLRDAIELFAVANGGEYPGDVLLSETPDGRTALDFLPDGERLVNPFTGLRTEPQPALAANLGQTGYMWVRPGHYVINGMGSTYPDDLIILTEESP